MNVLVLHSELGVLRGGGENFTRNLFSAFAQRGHHVAAAFVADRNGKYPLALPASIQPVPICGWWSSTLGEATLAAVGGYLAHHGRCRKEWDRIRAAISWRVFAWHKRRFQRRAEKKLRCFWQRFDAAYVHGDALLAFMAARYLPTVLRLPGPVTEELTQILREVDAVCANGDALLRVQSFLGEHAIELQVGLDEKLFKPGETSVRQRLGWTNRDKVIGYVGRLAHIKGVDLLSAAFRAVANDFPSAKLLLVGSGEQEKNIRSDLAKELSRRVVHIERDVDHENLPEWYRAMDLLVMPSRYENFSNAIIEAMACGVSFLASDVGGNRILAKSGAGILFDAESASALEACLRDVLMCRSQLKLRGQLAFEHVRNHYSWSATADKLENILCSIRERTNAWG
jgi:glycosyltransferase involved in cell wall biosynthesis